MDGKCETCRFYKGTVLGKWLPSTPAADAEKFIAGQCRRFPPVMARHVAGFDTALWITVCNDDFCGEYAPVEDK